MTAIDQLKNVGTSTWLDDLSRDRLQSGNLAELIKSKSIVGVTTNPAIFAAAMSKGTAYDSQIEKLKAAQADANSAVYAMSIDDVRAACDVFSEIYAESEGKDGRVSIEVDPRISEDRDATIAQARELWNKVDRPNVMIKIPATRGSLPAITDALAEGISVNVTLIFSVARYREVIAAYIDGIKKAAENELNVSQIHSVASFFVSRLDTEVDKRLEQIGSDEALSLRGKAGVANAQRAYAVFLEAFQAADLPVGAHVQRPLWASTGVKNPDYSPTLYVSELAGPDTVNTMPESTIDAVLAADDIHGDTLSSSSDSANEIFTRISQTGIDFEDVFAVLEQEGVDKFVAAWSDLLDSMESRLK
ncbi:transaldolase [Corynebacterium diphtheriae]|uniref:transaldolase n=1 Tax=Corynebacterium diphtheriae TaxID=1717 RepID=UPI0013C65D0A|nr:transaldolase [Corynebacterium diphtheriae]MBG9371881.1 transaldolase [Corynebacterium diphtheriae bv. mitis]CAB0605550.1 transaldolase [Corynebacterium diphtheriae]CAB0846490.1 transaldolase [Corynebacterium diphtheriae]